MKVKALIIAVMFFGALCTSMILVPDTAEAKCRYCKQLAFGACGAVPSSDYQSNPQRKHKHVSDGKKCVWCGLQNNPQRCSHSPNGQHEK